MIFLLTFFLVKYPGVTLSNKLVLIQEVECPIQDVNANSRSDLALKSAHLLSLQKPASPGGLQWKRSMVDFVCISSPVLPSPYPARLFLTSMQLEQSENGVGKKCALLLRR